jgi:hypothetical protein
MINCNSLKMMVVEIIVIYELALFENKKTCPPAGF